MYEIAVNENGSWSLRSMSDGSVQGVYPTLIDAIYERQRKISGENPPFSQWVINGVQEVPPIVDGKVSQILGSGDVKLGTLHLRDWEYEELLTATSVGSNNARLSDEQYSDEFETKFHYAVQQRSVKPLLSGVDCQLLWKEVKWTSSSTSAVCKHFKDGTTKCYVRGKNGGKAIDLAAFREIKPELNGNQNWFRETYDGDGSSSIEHVTENTPEKYFQKKPTKSGGSNRVENFQQQSEKSNWWKWFLVLGILAALGRTFSPSSGLNKKIQEAQREAESSVLQNK